MPVTSRALRLQAALDAAIAGTVDAQTTDLTRVWVRAWDQVSGELAAAVEEILAESATGNITRATMSRNTRLRAALATVEDALKLLQVDARTRMGIDIQHVVATAGEAQAAIVAANLPSDQTLVQLDEWARVDRTVVAQIVYRTTQRITSLTRPLSREAYATVERELVHGVIVGENPRNTARRMIRHAEMGFNGGLNRALVISRTEMLDAHRAACQLGQQQHTDVLAGWRWLAHLSPRTCRSCIAMNGHLFPVDQPGPNDHQCGRCARMPVTRTWAALGIDLPDPPDPVRDAEAWFADLPEAEQRAILGPKGYDAWSAGRWPMQLWSRQQRNDGWRDSHVPAPAPR